MSVVTTALGRVVSSENWKAIQGDQILRTLFNVAGGIDLASLARLTGLSPNETLQLCKELVRDGFVFDDGSNSVYRLTHKGTDRVSFTSYR